MRLLMTGNVGESLPPPYAGIPKRALLISRAMRLAGHQIGLVFVYRHEHEDDLDAQGTYFFDYDRAPTKWSKMKFILKYSVRNPFLYLKLVWAYIRAHHFVSKEALVNAAHGVHLDRIVETFKPDLILSEAAIIRTFMATQIAVRRNTPIVFDTYAEVHDRSILKLRGGESHRAVYWKELLAIPELVIAPSYYCGRGPAEFVPPEKVKVIYAGIEFEKYRDCKLTKEEARTRLGLPLNAFLVVAVGSLSPRKGHDHMIEAISMMDASKNAHAVICGPGDATWLKKLAKKCGITDRAHFFTGLSEEDLIALYRAVDVYCDASNTPRACLGMSVTEAMAVGKPVVAYDTAGLPEIVRNDKNGYLVPLDDIPALARALERVAMLPEMEYTRLAEESIRLAGELVELGACTRQMMNALEEVYQKVQKK